MPELRASGKPCPPCRERMQRAGRPQDEVQATQDLLRRFEAKCLAGQPSTPAECKQVGQAARRPLL